MKKTVAMLIMLALILGIPFEQKSGSQIPRGNDVNQKKLENTILKAKLSNNQYILSNRIDSLLEVIDSLKKVKRKVVYIKDTSQLTKN